MTLESGVLNTIIAMDLDEHDQDTTKSSEHKLVAINNLYHSFNSLHSRGTTMRINLQYLSHRNSLSQATKLTGLTFGTSRTS